MKQIARYNPAPVMGKATAPYVSAMQPHDHGAYVTYAAHAEKMQALQSRLDALELMQKQDFFYHLQKGLGKVAEHAITEVVKELIKKATQTAISLDPCKDLTSEMVKELCERMQNANGGMVMSIEEPEVNPYAGGWFVGKLGTMTLGDAYIKSGVISQYDLNVGVKTEPETLKCVKSDAIYFTPGWYYFVEREIESGNERYYLTSDNHNTMLEGDSRWKLEDGGAYLCVRNHVTMGEVVAVFKKP